MEEEHTKKPSHNNPEEAANYMKAVNTLLQSFVNDIHGFNHYARQDAYKNFLHTGPEVTSKMCLEGNIQTFDKKGQEAITKLFGHL